MAEKHPDISRRKFSTGQYFRQPLTISVLVNLVQQYSIIISIIRTFVYTYSVNYMVKFDFNAFVKSLNNEKRNRAVFIKYSRQIRIKKQLWHRNHTYNNYFIKKLSLALFAAKRVRGTKAIFICYGQIRFYCLYKFQNNGKRNHAVF